MAACINTKREQYKKDFWSSDRELARESAPFTTSSSKSSTDNMAETRKPSPKTDDSSAALTVRGSEHSASSSPEDIVEEDSAAVDALFALPKSVTKSMPRIYKSELAPLDLRFGMVREESKVVTLERASKKVIRQAVVNAHKAQASVCFVVKRPGCVLCHEQGRSLAQLLSEFGDNQVGAWAVVKEIDVDNEGLLTLYQQYFRFPFFRDTKLALYSALGDRRVTSLNPITLVKRFRAARKRLNEKGMEGNIIGKGEGMILGGIVIFDRKGNLKYAHEEQFGRELPVDEIRAVLKRLVQEGNSKRRESVCSSEFGPESSDTGKAW